MSTIKSSPSISFAPGAGCYRPDAPTPQRPGEVRPLPAPAPHLPGKVRPLPFPQRPPLGDIREHLNEKRSAELSNTQAGQLERIQSGVANGTISAREATKLLEQQAKVAEAIKNAQADGFISAAERAAIKRQQFVAGFGVSQAANSFEPSSLTRDRAASQAQAAQIGSLAQGIRSGDLSSNESTTLLQGQANIARNIANAQAEGHVSLFEKLHTGILQEAAGRDIRSQKIDLERAPHAHPRFTIDV